MCADVEAGQTGGSSAVNSNTAKDQLARALTELGRAIANGRHSETVCAGYQGLRAAAGHMHMSAEELFRIADRALGLSTKEEVVTAHARRWCFMCAKGTVPCDSCGGLGRTADEGKCAACNGMGVNLCSFCNGTGWADRQTIPAEIKKEVLQKQLRAVKEGLKVLKEKEKYFTPEAVAALNEPARRRISAWLMRLQVRLRDLAGSDTVADENDKLQMFHEAERIDSCLELLRRH